MIQKLGYYRQTPNPPLFHTLGKINKPRLVTELNYFRLRNTESGESSIGDGGSGPCCAKNPTQKNVPKTPPRKKPV